MLARRHVDALTGAISFSVATVVAMLVVSAATGLTDGFGSMRWLLLRFERLLPVAIVVAASIGVVMSRYHRSWFLLEQGASPGPGVALLGVVRAFALFPLYGGITFVVLLLWLAGGVASWAWSALRRSRIPFAPLDEAAAAELLPLWFMLAPLHHLGEEGSGLAPREALPRQRRSMPRWLPAVLLAVAVWTSAVSEETEERINPIALAMAATYWIGDYLLVMALPLGRRVERPGRRP
jgi:hypothetical protein